MAVKPEIGLQGRVTDIGQTFSNALMNVQRISNLVQQSKERPFRNRLLEAQAQTAEANIPTQESLENARQSEIIKSLGIGAQQIIPDLQAGRTDQVVAKLERRRNDLINSGLPTDETDEAIQLAQTNPAELLTRSQQAVDLAKRIDTTGVSLGEREFSSLTANLSPEEAERARRVKLGLDPRATGSASQTILREGTAEQIGDVEATIGEKKKLGEETGASTAKLKFKPQIEKAVIKARTAAKRKGEALSELNQARAALPGLTNAVDQLRELSTIATSTIGGKIFDSAVKQTGFGATKGATARAKFIAIVNNQVLPLLKPTFGAAFTVQEGEALKATMGDPDASPEEKMVQLDAFINQKMRDIETKQSELGQTTQAERQPKFLGFE